MRLGAFAALLLGVAASASAHRLDEYLQATTLTLEQDSVMAQVRLTPGVAVCHQILRLIDTNSDGKISDAEAHSYSLGVMRDMSLRVDGKPSVLVLRSYKFPTVDLIKKGLGEIQIDLTAATKAKPGKRALTFENYHLPKIGAYLVNCLVPEDPNLQVTGQSRNFLQSHYQIEYVQTLPEGPSGIYASLFGVIAICALQEGSGFRRRGREDETRTSGLLLPLHGDDLSSPPVVGELRRHSLGQQGHRGECGG